MTFLTRPTPQRAVRSVDVLAQSTAPNLLFVALPQADRTALAPHLERIGLARETVVYEEGAPITHLYFPVDAAFSLVRQSEGRAVEIGTIGREGMVGIPAIMYAGGMNARTFVQVEGAVDRIPAHVVVEQMEGSVPLRRSLMRYVSIFNDEVAQSVMCNRLHSLEERCARWILMTRDRTDSNVIPLKQQFLSLMLGVHRPAVTLAARALASAGLIRYSRGIITVENGPGLEEAACTCYAYGRERYHALFSGLALVE